MPTRVHIIHEVKTDWPGWNLCFQWCQYIHEAPEPSEFGYRFIWRHPDGKLQPARGQARIPSLKDLDELVMRARAEGWGDLDGREEGRK